MLLLARSHSQLPMRAIRCEARQLLREAAVGGILVLGDFVRGLSFFCAARDATMHGVDPALQAVEAGRSRVRQEVAASRIAPNRVSVACKPGD
jgi:hypothetical protein